MRKQLEAMQRAQAGLFRIAAAVVAVDQLTKAWVIQRLPVGEGIRIGTSWLFIRHVRNPGAAFGILQRYGFVPALAAAALIVLVFAYRGHLARQPAQVRWAVGLGVGGAAGNLIDRIARGAVIDFIDVSVWPVFNLADAAIVTAALILAMSVLRPPSDEGDVSG